MEGRETAAYYAKLQCSHAATPVRSILFPAVFLQISVGTKSANPLCFVFLADPYLPSSSLLSPRYPKRLGGFFLHRSWATQRCQLVFGRRSVYCCRTAKETCSAIVRIQRASVDIDPITFFLSRLTFKPKNIRSRVGQKPATILTRELVMVQPELLQGLHCGHPAWNRAAKSIVV